MMQTLPDVGLPDYENSVDPINWVQCDALRAKGFDAAAILALHMTRGEAMRLLKTISDPGQPDAICGCCQRPLQSSRGRLVNGQFTCYHCCIVGGVH